jgi:serine protease DegS
MKQFHSILLGLVFGALAAVATLLYQNLNTRSNDSLADAASAAAPSVVNIYTTKIKPLSDTPSINDYFFNQRRQRLEQKRELSLGSGVIVDKTGYIVTNAHVIQNADEILVLTFDNQQALAKIIGIDQETDLAILKIELPNLRAINMGKLDQIRVGDNVLAIGNPYGFGQTVSAGIISAKGRYGLNLNTYENFIQTDAAISTGSSGGALINIQGELIGINSAIYSQNGSSAGIGLAIPADIVYKVVNDTISHGQVIRGWLGLEVTQLTPAIATQLGLQQSTGVIITNTHPNGPAELAGLIPGDIITRIDHNIIKNGREGLLEVANLAPGKKINVEIVRNNAAQTLPVTVGIRPLRNSR